MASISVPVIKQYELGKPAYFQERACAACCLVSASIALGNTNASIQDAIDRGYVDGTSARVLNWNYEMTVTSQGGSESDCFARIVSEIIAGYPVMIQGRRPSSDHYVLAYGFIGNGDRADRIYVMDPVHGNCTLSTTYGDGYSYMNHYTCHS